MNRIIFTVELLLLLLVVSAPCLGQVVINECFTGAPDWCEIRNSGATAVDISSWTVTMTRDGSTTAAVTIPANTMLPAGGFLMVTESPTDPVLPPGVPRVLSSNIFWVANDTGTCALNDAAGVGVDFILFGGATALPPGNPLAPFTGSINNTSDLLARNSDVDTDDASDWAVGVTATPADVNPGQTPSGPPIVSFSASSTSVPVGSTVSFTNTTTGNPTSFAWDLDGDSVVDSTAAQPSFVYTTAGSFDVTLTATNAAGSASLTMPGLINVFVPTSVTVPYVEDFTSGSLGSEWALASDAAGRIQIAPITDGGAPSPDSGGNALIMDSSVDGTFATNTATLFVDLVSSGNALLSYNFRETGDEDDPEDGVFISDGTTTVQVVSHNGRSGTWTKTVVDLAAEAAANGLVATSAFEVIFSQRDNFGVPTDGGFFDDVRLVLPDTGQPNGPLAYLDINGGTNQIGFPADIGVNGPFFSQSNQLDILFQGQPLQPFLLLSGPLNKNNLVLPVHGSIDIGSDQTFSDVIILLNGLEPGLFNSLAVLDATGASGLTFGLAGVPLGTVLGFQGIVINNSTSLVEFTAAFEVTVN